ncbi:Cytochrome b561 and DOMON domain-containing protein At3g61750 [Linum perenne]
MAFSSSSSCSRHNLKQLMIIFFYWMLIFVSSQDNIQAHSSSELCKTTIDPTRFLPPPYSNITNMACNPIWNDFILRYHKGENNVMTFVLSGLYTSGWVGIGFSNNGMMVGSSAMVGWVTKKGIPIIKQYYLQGSRQSQVIPDAGELDLNHIPPAVSLHPPQIHLSFQAKFQAPLVRQPILLAFGTKYPHHNHRLSHHDDKTTILFDFSAPQISAVVINAGEIKRNHGVLATLGWGVFLPVGAIVARYLRHNDPLWFYLHALIQFIGFLFGLAAIVLGQQLYYKTNANVPAHRGIGIFLLALAILQILAFFLRPNKDSKIRKYWSWYHRWSGRSALFFAAVNVVLGIHVGHGGSTWKVIYGLIVTAILVAVISLEALLWLGWRSDQNNTDIKNYPPPASNFQMNSMQ